MTTHQRREDMRAYLESRDIHCAQSDFLDALIRLFESIEKEVKKMNIDQFKENLKLQAAHRLREASNKAAYAENPHTLREIHKHIHRAQTYLWALEDSLKLNDR